MRELYQDNIQRAEIELSSLEKKINKNSLLRLAVILVGGAALFKIFQWNNIWLLLIAVLMIVLSFAYLVLRQSRLEKAKADAQAFLRINTNEVALGEGKPNIYSEGEAHDEGKHPYVSDLDVFGAKSLFAKINRAATPDGVERLVSWFVKSTSKEEILLRQQASTELRDKGEWIQQLQTKLLFNLGQTTNIRIFLSRYLQDGGLDFGSVLLRTYVPIAPYLFVAGVLFSLLVFPIWNILLLLGLMHLGWTLALAGKVSHFSSRIDKIGATLIAYSDAVKMIEEENFSSKMNQNLQQNLKTKQQENLSVAFRRLGTLVDKLDARNNILIGSLLNIIFLWDFKQVMAIVRWKKSYEGNILNTFNIMADFEALISLAVLQRNHPQWTVPVILDDVNKDPIVANKLNHPLIPVDKAVANDYNSEDHRIALITGSNMAGKSTFLRTLGINAVLAYAGAVVCADRFELPIYRIVSYMRIKDDLNESTSTFKAELDRMKFILDLVAAEKDTFVLIDEMLRGTNSVDKYLGSRAIIKKLIAMGGRGMVATHDLQLASLQDDYPGILKNYHFDIQVEQGEMLFDYKLKDGKCTVFNASLLLKGIGVEVGN
ncbi:MutS-related protein [Sphingobacterium faecale]|uniref:DNA mismatch repair protein MutS n=1 Tax=Sphingobacterium faecale TaxID=2803775 RepID=A0ABS1R7A5_9SPHI|nr:DNA mismatch repair protein MutS [Sphingobacterium faecale]MBL1410573.1 DNA mismatch repair protein MutS [Sphingobacterium faecale]